MRLRGFGSFRRLALTAACFAAAAACLAAVAAWHAAPAAAALIPDNPPLNTYWYGPATAQSSTAAVALGTAGDPYVAGTAFRIGHGNDITLTRVHSVGGWTRHLDGGHGNDTAADVCVSLTNTVYVLGTARNSHHHNDILVARYTAAGKRVWVRRYGGSRTAQFSARTAAVDSSGRLTVCGVRVVNGTSVKGHADLVFLKYAASGKRLWVKLIPAAKGQSYSPRQMVLDDRDRAFVAGTRVSSGAADMGFVARCTADGRGMWLAFYGAFTPEGTRFDALALDPAGTGVYVAGDSAVGSGRDAIVEHYDTGATRTDVITFDPGSGAGRVPYGLVVAPDGDLLVCGRYYSGTDDYRWTTRVDTSGVTPTVEWSEDWDSGATGDVGTQLAVDGSQEVIEIGLAGYPADNPRPVIEEYSGDGDPQWISVFTQVGVPSSPAVTDLAVRGSGVDGRAWVTATAPQVGSTVDSQLVLGYGLALGP